MGRRRRITMRSSAWAAENGTEMIEPMRGSGERAFIACTVDLLEAGVDIERLNAVVFFRYLQSRSSSTRWSAAARASTRRRRSTNFGSTITPASPICSAPISSRSRRVLRPAETKVEVVAEGGGWRRGRQSRRGGDWRKAGAHQSARALHPRKP